MLIFLGNNIAVGATILETKNVPTSQNNTYGSNP